MITNEELTVLETACRNTRMAQKAIHTVLNKVYDEELAYDLGRQADVYRELEHKAERTLRREGLGLRDSSGLERAMLWASIQTGTLLNTSTAHVADMMIRGNARGITDLMKATHNNKLVGSYANELAGELMDFEEKNIEKLKSYL